jgi:outer membrane protein assembly factor BamB
MDKYMIVFSILLVSVFLFCGSASAATVNQLTPAKINVGTTLDSQNTAKLTAITPASKLASTAWPKFHQNNRNTGQSPYMGPLTSPTLKWKYNPGSYTYTSYPVIGSDRTVYFGCDNDYFYALKPNGTLKWKYKIDSTPNSPAIGSDGTLYFGCDNSYLYALNPNGTLKWKYKTNSMRMISSPAIGVDGTIYLGSGLDLYAITSYGKLKWKYSTTGFVTSSPAIANDGTIYFGSHNSYVFALTSSGKLKWKYKTGYEIYSSPAIGSDGTVYIGSRDDYLYAINSYGKLKWKYKTASDVFSSPAIAKDGTIYITSSNLYALTPSGKIKWRYYNIGGSPIIGNDGTVYAGNSAYGITSYLFAVSSNGNLRWKYKLDEVGISPVIANDGTIYIGSGKYLYVLIDKTAPAITFKYPYSYATGVSRTSTLYLKFSEYIKASTYFNYITVKNLSKGTTITITKAISGNTLYIKTTATRSAYTWYQVTIPKAAIKDYAGNNLLATYTFKFKTGT